MNKDLILCQSVATISNSNNSDNSNSNSNGDNSNSEHIVNAITNAYTVKLYSKFQYAIKAIEQAFFIPNGLEQFPDLVLSINSSMKSCVMAFVRPNSLYDTDSKKMILELAINPKTLNLGLTEIMSTLTHELCHIYECSYIHIPRGGYHTKDWHNLMIQCGLDPIYMNKSKTSVNEKIIKNGVFTEFIEAFEKHNKNFFTLVTFDPSKQERPVTPEGTPRADNYDKPVKVYNRAKICFTCPTCGAKCWGKPTLSVMCGECHEIMQPAED